MEGPARHAYTHVCKLCWPKGGLDSGSEATEGSEAATTDAVDEPEVSSGAQGPRGGTARRSGPCPAGLRAMAGRA